jgi:hypothetical protein
LIGIALLPYRPVVPRDFIASATLARGAIFGFKTTAIHLSELGRKVDYKRDSPLIVG